MRKGLQVVTGAWVAEATAVAKIKVLVSTGRRVCRSVLSEQLAALFRIFRLIGPLGGGVKKKGRGDPAGSVPCLLRIYNHSRKGG